MPMSYSYKLRDMVREHKPLLNASINKIKNEKLWINYPREIYAHETIGHAADSMGIVNPPSYESIIQLKWIKSEYYDDLVADVVASHFVSKETIIAAKLESNMPNWWVEYPEIVSEVEKTIPWWYGKDYLGSKLTSISVTNEVLTNGTN